MSTPKAKKTKSSGNNGGQQQSIASFFGASPSKVAPSPSKGVGKNKKSAIMNHVKNHGDLKGQGKGKAIEVEVIDLVEDDDEYDVVLDEQKVQEPPTDAAAVSNGVNQEALALISSAENGLLVEEGDSSAVAGPSNHEANTSDVPSSALSSKSAAKTFGSVTRETAPLQYPDLSSDPLLFDVSSCPWPSGTPAPYSFLTHAFVALTSTRSRILLVNILVNTLRLIIRHDPASLLASLYLLSNSISPAYMPIEMNIGPSVISKALQSVSGLSSAALRKL